MERYHGIIMTHTRGVSVGGGGTDMYMVSFPCVLKVVACPVDGSLARENNPGRLRKYYMHRDQKCKIVILQGIPAPLPRCD